MNRIFLQRVVWSFKDILYFRDGVFLYNKNKSSNCITHNVIQIKDIWMYSFAFKRSVNPIYAVYIVFMIHVCI